MYYGELKDGKRDKRGGVVYTSGFYKGSTFEGEFKDNFVNGYGILNDANGDVFKGEYVDSRKNGEGIYTHPDGSYYAGEYKDD